MITIPDTTTKGRYNGTRFLRITDDTYIAPKQRVASNSVVRAWYASLPESELPVTHTPDEQVPYGLIASMIKSLPEGSTLLQLVREPVDRFRSIVAQSIKRGRASNAEEVLASAEISKRDTIDAVDQVSSLVRGCATKLYRYDRDLVQFLIDTGLGELPTLNESEVDVVLSPEQISRIEKIYADDIALYESITEAGQTYTASPEPATDELKAAKIRELEAARYQAEVAGSTLPDGKKFVRTDKETQAELGKALSIISTVNPALEIDWKFPDGEVVHMDSTQIQQIAGAVFAHVQATRTAFKDKAAEVEAATTKDELDSITW